MNILVVGISHHSAPLEVRERLWFSDDEIRRTLPVFKQRFFSECFLVSTCNRTELYGMDPRAADAGEVDSIIDQLIAAKEASPFAERKHFYHYSSSAAVRHLFRVTSGIDSMVIGDVQILNQIKEAHAIAMEGQTIGTFLHRALQSAYHVGKRTRTETTIAEGAVSVSYAAVELASRIFADLSKRSALLIGAGETGELTAKHLTSKGIGHLFLTNRTRAKTDELVSALGGKAIDFNALVAELARVDIVISSVNVTGFVLTKQSILRAMKERSHKPLFIIDIGVPRNIDPAANEIENVFLHDMDTLAGIVDQNLQKRQTEIPKVGAIIDSELADFLQWYESLELNPTIKDLNEFFERVRREEVEKHIAKFSSGDRKMIDIVTKRIINKLLHLPMVNLKNGHAETDEDKRKRLDVVRSLFGLNKTNDE